MWLKLIVHHNYLDNSQNYFPYPIKQGYILVERHSVDLLVVMVLVLPNNALRQCLLCFGSVLYSNNSLYRLDSVTVVDPHYADFYPLEHDPNLQLFAYIEYYFVHSILTTIRLQQPLYLLRTVHNH